MQFYFKCIQSELHTFAFFEDSDPNFVLSRQSSDYDQIDLFFSCSDCRMLKLKRAWIKEMIPTNSQNQEQ